MKRFNQKFWTYCFAIEIATGLSLWFGGNPSPFTASQTIMNRVPAQDSSSVDPSNLHYLNPRQECTDDWASCGQANDCCSSLCLQGSCIPRYFSNQKGNPGQFCMSQDQCFSGSCDTASNKCVGSTTNVCAYVAQFCNADAQCCSGICNLNNSQCQGNSAKECGPVTAFCGSNAECCSEVCDTGSHQCAGSAKDPAAFGQHCNANAQCISNVCDISRQICQ